MTNEHKPQADGPSVERPVRPDPERAAFEAWAAKRWGREAHRHTSATCGEWDAWQAAVAAERERWRLLIDGDRHIYAGDCPDAENWHSRDSKCPACRALGDWRA